MTHAQAESRLTISGCVAIVAAQGVAVGWVLLSRAGSPQLLPAVAIASTVTGTGAIAGWLVARCTRRGNPAAVASGGLAATALRLLPPLLALGWISAAEPELAQAGAGGLLVAFYLTMLVVAILLHLLETREGRRGRE